MKKNIELVKAESKKLYQEIINNGYDENIAQEIKDIKVELVERLTKERDQAVEDARKLLMENKDLKDFLLAKGLVDENYEVIDDE